jgi:hypothetical protein
MEQAIVVKFYKKAQVLGFDQESACAALHVKDISQYGGSIGDALNTLAQFKKQSDSGGSATTAVALAPDEQRALYQSEELARFGAMIRAIAPWANDPKRPVSDQDIALIVSRGEGMGLDVLNPHEAHVIKQKNGGVTLQIAHALMAQWAEQIHGGHTRPRYRMLDDTEKESRGILKNDYACECAFIMKSDISNVAQMVQSGIWTPEQALSEMTVSGIGVVKATEWGDPYFAPNARDKKFKLEQRAYTDAVRRKFGTPGRADNIRMRRMRGEDEIALEDWQAAADEPESTRADLARANASDSEPRELITDAEFSENVELLRGDGTEI